MGISARASELNEARYGAHITRKRKRDNQSLSEDSIRREYACPFMARDPARSECKKGYGTVSRLKEHIRRRHLPSIFCPRCGLDFQTSRERWKHARSAIPCELSSVPPLGNGDTISKEAHDELNRRTKKNDDPEDTWMQIYKTIFPDVPDDGIPSPFVDALDIPTNSKALDLAIPLQHSGLDCSRRVRRKLMEFADTMKPGIQMELLLELERTVQKYENKEGNSSDAFRSTREITFFPSGSYAGTWSSVDRDNNPIWNLEPTSVLSMTDYTAMSGVHESTPSLTSEANSSVHFESQAGLVDGSFFDISPDLMSRGYYNPIYPGVSSDFSIEDLIYQSSTLTPPPVEIPTTYSSFDYLRSKGWGFDLTRTMEHPYQLESPFSTQLF